MAVAMRSYDPENVALADSLNPQGCGVAKHDIDCLCDVDLDKYGRCPEPTPSKLRDQAGTDSTYESLHARLVRAERLWFLNKFWPELMEDFGTFESDIKMGLQGPTLGWGEVGLTQAFGGNRRTHDHLMKTIDVAAAAAHRLPTPSGTCDGFVKVGVSRAVSRFAEWQYRRLPHMSKASMVPVIGEWDPTTTITMTATNHLRGLPNHAVSSRSSRLDSSWHCVNKCKHSDGRLERASRDGLCGRCHQDGYMRSFEDSEAVSGAHSVSEREPAGMVVSGLAA